MKRIKIVFSIIIILIIYVMFFVTISNNNEISTLEKRNLSTYPKFTLNALINGKYLDSLTNAFKDQLAFRNSLVKGYYLFQFQRYNGDVVIGKNNELYSAYQRVTNESKYLNNLKENTKLINKVAKEVTNSKAKFIFLSIPRKDAIEKENLPKSYISSDEIYNKSVAVVKENLTKDVTFINAYQIFNDNKNKNIRFYYMNDHHITPRGAELLYNEIITDINDTRVNNIELNKLYEVKKTIINGSFNNQIGQSVKPTLEELYLVPKFKLDYVRYDDEKISNRKVYGQGNTYEEAFMEGDYGFTLVDTKREDLPNIMFVGSSFTNILETLSIHDFNKMVSIDYRHNKSNNDILYYVKKYDIDYVVYIPSQSNDAFSNTKVKEHLGY